MARDISDETPIESRDTLIAYGKSEAGDWKKEEDGKLSLRVEDNHYKIWDGNNTMLVTFVPLGEPWWGIQAKMGEECYTYVLAEINQGELILHENGCSEIEKVPGLGGTVDFSGFVEFLWNSLQAGEEDEHRSTADATPKGHHHERRHGEVLVR